MFSAIPVAGTAPVLIIAGMVYYYHYYCFYYSCKTYYLTINTYQEYHIIIIIIIVIIINNIIIIKTLFKNVVRIDFVKSKYAVPGYVCMVLIPFTNSILYGVAVGYAVYIAIMM